MCNDLGSCEGYAIQERIPIGTHFFSIGYNPNAPQPYVIWQSNSETPNEFYWGRYSSSKKTALRDLHSRIANEMESLLERIDFMIVQAEKRALQRGDVQRGDSR